MKGRIKNRKKQRIPCHLVRDGRRQTGLVLDLSVSGLFVQTSAKAGSGERLDLIIGQKDAEDLDLVVEVVRKKSVPAHLMSVAKGGVGVRIVSAPEAYYALLTDKDMGDDPFAPAPETRLPRFRVRVSQLAGPRSRRVEVQAGDEEQARQLALAEMGEDWKVLDVEAL